MKTHSLHPESIRNLFNNIAPTYDFLNHLLSLGRDLYWRKMAVRELKGFGGWILDIATGTGDGAFEMIRVIKNGGKVIVLEFTFPRDELIGRLYPFYFKNLLPWLGGVISGDRGAYAYLPKSVTHFPHAEDYEE